MRINNFTQESVSSEPNFTPVLKSPFSCPFCFQDDFSVIQSFGLYFKVLRYELKCRNCDYALFYIDDAKVDFYKLSIKNNIVYSQKRSLLYLILLELSNKRLNHWFEVDLNYLISFLSISSRDFKKIKKELILKSLIQEKRLRNIKGRYRKNIAIKLLPTLTEVV